MAQLKTYRNIHTDALKVGELEILPGELVPEAEEWERHTVDTLIRTRRLEVVYLDQETFDQEVGERNERLDYYPDEGEEETSEPSEDDLGGDDDPGDTPEEKDPEETEEKTEQPKTTKRVVRRKKDVKPDDAPSLTEQNV